MEKYLAKLRLSYQNTDEERKLSELLFTEQNKSNSNISLGDQRLNSIAALTYNAAACDRIFAMLEKAITPTDYPWYTIHRALLVLHTIVLYGSEKAIDMSIQITRFIYSLQDYNSALVKKSMFSFTGGTDYGAPVRSESKILISILATDDSIRKARNQAREGQASLVPIGNLIDLSNETQVPEMHFGQGVDSFVGAKFSLEAVPGIYEGRPERYFDNLNDPRNRNINTGDHQFTREAMAPDLLDLSYDSVGNTNLPEAQYLPALEKQRELEIQLAQQKKELELLQNTLLRQNQNINQNQQQTSYNNNNNLVDLLGNQALEVSNNNINSQYVAHMQQTQFIHNNIAGYNINPQTQVTSESYNHNSNLMQLPSINQSPFSPNSIGLTQQVNYVNHISLQSQPQVTSASDKHNFTQPQSINRSPFNQNSIGLTQQTSYANPISLQSQNMAQHLYNPNNIGYNNFSNLSNPNSISTLPSQIVPQSSHFQNVNGVNNSFNVINPPPIPMQQQNIFDSNVMPSSNPQYVYPPQPLLDGRQIPFQPNQAYSNQQSYSNSSLNYANNNINDDSHSQTFSDIAYGTIPNDPPPAMPSHAPPPLPTQPPPPF